MPATITSLNPTSIGVLVPAGMTSGQISVSVAGQAGNSATSLVVSTRSVVGLEGSPMAGTLLLPAPGTAATDWSLTNGVSDVAADGAGNLYVASGPMVFKVAAGVVSLFAGSGMTSPLGDGGPATSAGLNSVVGVAVDASGSVFLMDTNDSRLRMIPASTGAFYGQSMTAGDIYTIAGNGLMGTPTDGVLATNSSLNSASGVAVDASGDLFITEADCRLLMIPASTGTFYGQSMTADDIYTVAGNGTAGYAGDGGPAGSAEIHNPSAIAVDGSGNLYIADALNYSVRMVSAAGGSYFGQSMTAGDIYTIAGNGVTGAPVYGSLATSGPLPGVTGVAVDGGGDVLIGDYNTSHILMVPASTNTFYGQSMTMGDIYTVAGNGTAGYAGDGGAAGSAEISYPDRVSIDGSGNILIADSGNDRVREVSTAGTISTLAGNETIWYSGDGGPASAAQINPTQIYVNATGDLIFVDATDTIRMIPATGGTSHFGISMPTARDIYRIAGVPGQFLYGGDGGAATSATLNSPTGLAVDGSGNLLISDSNDSRIREVSASGTMTTFAGNGTAGYSGDGGPAASAELNYPQAIALDGAGDLFIADQNDNRIREVSTSGVISTFAGNGTAAFSGDGAGATVASINSPRGVAVDAAGDVFIADTNDYRIREVPAASGSFYGVSMLAGDMYTIAGNGQMAGFGTYSGDGGPALQASLYSPQSLEVDPSGDVYVSDVGPSGPRFIRRIDPTGIITLVSDAGAPFGLDAFGNLFLAAGGSSGGQVVELR